MLPEPLQTVTLSVYDKYTNSKQSYTLKTVDVKDQHLIIQSPMQLLPNGKPLRSGTKVEISYVRAGTMYLFETEVIKAFEEQEPLLLLRTPFPEQIQKIQRRQYLRVPTNLVMTLSLNDGKEQLEAPLIDLSGGGFLLALTLREVEKLSLSVDGKLPIEERGRKHYIPFKARVVNVKYNQEKKRYEVAFQFTEIKESDREVIIRYCFARQLELHRKGVKS